MDENIDLEKLARMIKNSFDAVDERFTAIDNRFDEVDQNLPGYTSASMRIDRRLDRKIDRLHAALTEHREATAAPSTRSIASSAVSSARSTTTRIKSATSNTSSRRSPQRRYSADGRRSHK